MIHSEVEAVVPRLQNVVMICDLHVKVDLLRLAWSLPGMSYNPKGFAAAIFYNKSPQCTFLLFASGQMVCTGCSSILQASHAIYGMKSLLNLYGVQCTTVTFRPKNVVCSVTLPFQIDVEQIHASYGQHTSYEPDLFPGCVFKPPTCSCTFLLFSSGNVVITGAESLEHATQVFLRFKHVIWAVRVRDE